MLGIISLLYSDSLLRIATKNTIFVRHPMHSISLTLYQGLWLASESLEEKSQGSGN